MIGKINNTLGSYMLVRIGVGLRGDTMSACRSDSRHMT